MANNMFGGLFNGSGRNGSVDFILIICLFCCLCGNSGDGRFFGGGGSGCGDLLLPILLLLVCCSGGCGNSFGGVEPIGACGEC